MVNEMLETPYKGMGKPEPLKYELTGMWSRRLKPTIQGIREGRDELLEKAIAIIYKGK